MSNSRVLISYTSGTKPLAEELAKALLQHGIESWAGFKDLDYGQRWTQELDRAIEDADLFLFLVDPKSSATHWQEAEWRSMLAKAWTDSSKRVLPVVVGSAEPPPFLRNWVSLNVDPAAEPRAWTRRVLGAISSIQKQTAQGISSSTRRERAERLHEIGKAVETLEDPSLGESGVGMSH
jgi:hypothetical protein